jgi:hypothetical protein
MAAEIGMRAKAPAPKRLDFEHHILSAEALETIHDWEDVDADELRAACSRGETLSVDE